ncbi:MAG TPA: sugar phosphate nucleotidyltransferase [Acidimicrobiia bacterium]|nr:sugar phosphate nucleotidyltransferase [Acidimicrobiia bacterium]
MKAVVMAGGEGTRLRPLTSNQPKPMMPMANRPLMEHVVRNLAGHGIDDIVVTVAFLASHIRNYFGDGSELGVSMRYATEETPLGTAGSVRNAAAELDDTFLVVSGDVLSDIDLDAVVKAHRSSGALATIALRRVENPVDFGIVITSPDGWVERFLEKPTWGQVFSDTINTGIYVLEPQILDLIPEHQAVDFSEEVFPAALRRGMAIQGLVVDGYWEDVGTIEAYHRAHRDVLDHRVAAHIPGFRLGDGIWLGEGADVDPAAEITGPVIIGDNCRIEAGATVGEYTVLGSNVVVKHDATLARTVVHDHVYVGPGVTLRGAIVGRSADLRRAARASEGVVLGEECFVGEGATINQGVKVYPYKTVEAGAVVNSSIVWESRGQRTLFGRRGVRGLANVDVTAELAVRLAAAYGTSLKKGSVVCCSRDTSRVARTLKRAVMSGLNLSGVHVEDLELAPVPLTRFHVRSERAQGGVTVRLSPDDPASVEIRFFDALGADIDDAAKRKIERLLARDDFRRAFAGDIGDIVFPPRVLEYYTSALIRSIDAETVREQAFKLVLDTSFGSATVVLNPVLAKLGAEVLAVNPFAATAPAAHAVEDLGIRLARVQNLVRTSGSHLGVVFDPDGETLRVVDDSGHILTDEETLLSLVALVTAARPGARLALPVAVSREAERIATGNGATIAWSKLSTASLMEIAGRGGVDFAASGSGGYLWPDFLPAADAVATMAKLLDLLASSGRRLSSVVAGLPAVHVAHETVSTPWERKGTVMRTTMEQAQDKELVLVDGVKVLHADGWALVLPDPEEPLTHVWAEGGSEGGARALAQEYVGRIRAALTET